MRFEDKVAVVTGAGGGIGEAYARALASEGAAVVVAEINADQGGRVAREIQESGGRAEFVRTDVSDEESTLAMGGTASVAAGSLHLAHGGLARGPRGGARHPERRVLVGAHRDA